MDTRCVRRVFGQVEATELKAIDEGLVLLLGLGHRPTPGVPTAGIGESG